MNPAPLSLAIDSRLECVPAAGLLVREFCQRAGAPPPVAAQMELCVVEAANNSVQHAYAGKPGHTVLIVARLDDGELEFEVRDQGTSMDKAEMERKHAYRLELDPGNIATVHERGRGLAIIESIMDRIDYDALRGSNRFIMRKRLKTV
jgi:serine/threonine-protein kinase RsbW